MTSKIQIGFALIGLLFAQISVACDKPAEISVPDGNKASAEEMADAGKAYHQYMINMQLYQVCLEDEANQDRLQADELDKSEVRSMENRYAGLHNSASASMAKATEEFEQSVTEYKAKQ